MKLLKKSFLIFILSFFASIFSIANLNASELDSLKITDVEVVDLKTVDLSFNVELDPDSLVYLNIMNNDNDLEDIEYSESNIIWNKLSLTFLENLTRLNTYSVTVITLDWINWEQINAWVDWIIEFEVSEDTPEHVEENNENVDLNSAWEQDNEVWGLEDIINEVLEEEDENNENLDLNWTETEDVEIAQNNESNNDEMIVEVAAKESEDLPQTWPTETLLFMLFSLIATWLFFSLRRRLI